MMVENISDELQTLWNSLVCKMDLLTSDDFKKKVLSGSACEKKRHLYETLSLLDQAALDFINAIVEMEPSSTLAKSGFNMVSAPDAFDVLKLPQIPTSQKTQEVDNTNVFSCCEDESKKYDDKSIFMPYSTSSNSRAEQYNNRTAHMFRSSDYLRKYTKNPVTTVERSPVLSNQTTCDGKKRLLLNPFDRYLIEEPLRLPKRNSLHYSGSFRKKSRYRKDFCKFNQQDSYWSASHCSFDRSNIETKEFEAPVEVSFAQPGSLNHEEILKFFDDDFFDHLEQEVNPRLYSTLDREGLKQTSSPYEQPLACVHRNNESTMSWGSCQQISRSFRPEDELSAISVSAPNWDYGKKENNDETDVKTEYDIDIEIRTLQKTCPSCKEVMRLPLATAGALKLHSPLRSEAGLYDVKVCHVNSEKDFYVILKTEEPSLVALEDELKSCQIYESLFGIKVHIGNLCVIFMKNGEVKRGLVEQYLPEDICVYLVDSGKYDHVARKFVGPLLQRHAILPTFAIHCCITGSYERSTSISSISSFKKTLMSRKEWKMKVFTLRETGQCEVQITDIC